ncbi:hypothetical protein HG531_009526 [Fusarium graminearum]|nr:hypothetical protein HG531_009526 [Fusarium graminearum]CAF3476041.1 unnamed protein product [Fusarium graminearum]
MTQARILVIQQVFTAANYEYAIRQDGSIQPEIKLTGILNTYAMNPGEDTHGWGTQVYPGMSSCPMNKTSGGRCTEDSD